MSSPLAIETPVPAPDRRATTLRALGAAPLFYRSEVEARQRLPMQERVHVYVDVSGSMEGVKGPLYGAVLDCEALVHPQVHLFSTQVAEVSPAQLRANVTSPNGTTFAGLGVFEQDGLRAMVHKAVRAAASRSAEMGR